MAVLPGLFGGDNVVGFFGGGRYRPDQQNFMIPDDQAGAMNFRMAEGGSGQAQDALARYNPLAGADQTRQALNQSLMGQLSGTGPSVAQQQLNQTTQGNIANAYAMGQAGPRNAMTAKLMADRAGSINQQAAGQGALLRAQEVQNAQGQLGAQRGQDLGQYDMLNKTAQGYLGQQMQLQGMQQQGRQAAEAATQAGFEGAQKNSVGGKLLEAGANVAAGFAKISDERTKKDIHETGKSIDGVDEVEFRYRGDPKRQLYRGVIAQDVAKERPEGVMAGPDGILRVSMPKDFPRPVKAAKGGQVMGDRVCAGCGNMNSDCVCGSRNMAKGGPVDSVKNDTVPIMASPGEVVLPRSVTLSEDAPEKAKAFVAAIRAQRMKRAA